MDLPDITKAQIAAIVGQVITLIVAFGVDLDEAQQTTLVASVTAVIVVLLWADKEIRQHRAENADKIQPRKTSTNVTTKK